MDDYISREAAIEAFGNADADVLEDYGDGACDWGFGMKNIQNVLNSVPAADAEPVRHGRWINRNGCVVCDQCGTSPAFWTMPIRTVNDYPHYCYSCGSKMRLER